MTTENTNAQFCAVHFIFLKKPNKIQQYTSQWFIYRLEKSYPHT